MIVVLRFLLIMLAITFGLYLLRRLAPQLMANPRLRMLLSGLGNSLFRIYLLRRLIPILIRVARSLFFFR